MRAKIIASIGPASADKEVLHDMIRQGMDVCRINFSHGSYDQYTKILRNISSLAAQTKENIAVIADLQGPKIRVGTLPDAGLMLKDGQTLILTSDIKKKAANTVYISYQHFAADVKAGEKILLDDGKLMLQVVATDKKSDVKTKVLHGGLLTSHKGVNLPDTHISLPSLTAKDLEDLKYIVTQDIQWVALSFVRSRADIKALKKELAKHKMEQQIRVIAKIEKPEALKDIDGIIEASDAIMVARGDLGVEVPLEQVPLIQKEIVRKCLVAGKPVIIATQMMESMITNISPTRAEVNDVANSLLDGADALMLSAETSVGKFPAEVVGTMHKIILNIEANRESIYYKHFEPKDTKSGRFISDSVIYNACTLAKHTDAKAIIAMTHTGYSAFRLASHRPKAGIFIFTSNLHLLRLLNLAWGVRGYYYDKFYSTDHTVADLKDYLKKHGIVKKGDHLVNVMSMPIQELGKTNTIKLSQV